MKASTKLSLLIPSLLGLALFLYCGSAHAQTPGDLTVNNLTVNNNATGVLPTVGKRYVIVEQLTTDTDQQRGAKLLAAYAKAKTMSPSMDNRITVLIPPGDYDLGANGITLDTSYIDLVGMLPARMTKRVIHPITKRDYTVALGEEYEEYDYLLMPQCGLRIYGAAPTQGVIKQTAGHVRIANMVVKNTLSSGTYPPDETSPASYWPESGLAGVVIEHVLFAGYGVESGPGDYKIHYVWSMRKGVRYDGIFRDCVAGDSAFGADHMLSEEEIPKFANGYFEDCVASNNGFGGVSDASGVFVFCTANSGFGYKATGTFRNCVGGDYSFGEFFAHGTFEHCFAGDYSFNAGTGVFRNCISGISSFSMLVFWEGSAEHCSAGAGSFGLDAAQADFSTPRGDLSMGDFNQ